MSAEKRIWFVSDIHLRYGDEQYLNQFLAFLDAAARGCDELYIVGDLFEFWIGDRQATLPFYQPLFDHFRRVTAAGLRIRAVHGNRDFLMGKAFEDAGLELLPEEVLLTLGGNQVHISHGDQFCIHDHSYQRARRIMRSAPLRWLAGWMPAWMGTFLARAYRGISERKKARKKAGYGNRFHTIEDGLRAEVQRAGHDVVLCGHIHDLGERSMPKEGGSCRILTTGAWEEEGPHCAAFAEGRLGFLRFQGNEEGELRPQVRARE